MFRTFTVGNCKCFSNDTRDKLLSIIEAGCGTLDAFDALVQALEISFTVEDEASITTATGSMLRRYQTRSKPALTRSASNAMTPSDSVPGERSPASQAKEKSVVNLQATDEEPIDDIDLYIVV